MSTAPTLPPLHSRHPVVIGLLEALRALLILTVPALLVALAAWFIAIAELQPLTVVLGWAAGLLAAASGWEIGASVGLPPTLLTVGVFFVLVSALRRTRRALAANELLVRAGTLPATRYAGITGIATCLAGIGAVLVAAGIIAGTPTVVGGLRCALVLAVPALVACLGPETRRGPAGRWAQALLDTIAARTGATWADAAEGSLRVLRRIAVGFGLVALAGTAAALASGWTDVTEAVASYSDPVAASLGLGVVQLIFAPTVLILALSWMSGAGIHVAVDMIVTPFTAHDAVVPAIPVLAAIPGDTTPWGWAFLIVLPVAAGVAAGGRREWVETLDWRTATVVGVLAVACSAGLAVFATGSIGPAGLEVFGVPVLAAAGTISGSAIVGVFGAWGLSLLANRAEADR